MKSLKIIIRSSPERKTGHISNRIWLLLSNELENAVRDLGVTADNNLGWNVPTRNTVDGALTLCSWIFGSREDLTIIPVFSIFSHPNLMLLSSVVSLYEENYKDSSNPEIGQKKMDNMTVSEYGGHPKILKLHSHQRLCEHKFVWRGRFSDNISQETLNSSKVWSLCHMSCTKSMAVSRYNNKDKSILPQLVLLSISSCQNTQKK